MKKLILLFLGILCFSTNVNALYVRIDTVGYSLSDNCSADEPFQEKRELTHNGNAGKYGNGGKYYDGPCLSCMTEKSLLIEEGHEKDFEICENREMFLRYSVLKKCPEDKPLKDYLKGCFSCGELRDVLVENSSDCSVCGDMRREIDTDDKIYCVLDKSPDPKYPLVAYYGARGGVPKLRSCEEISPQETSEKNCDLCPNRTWNEAEKTCVLRCSEDNKIATRDGCVSRDEKYFYFWYSEECSDFPDYISLKNGECVLKGYFAGGRDRYVISSMWGKNYRAYSCTDERDVVTEKDLCDLCPNREFVERKWCILKETK